jgi:hypothetical protein
MCWCYRNTLFYLRRWCKKKNVWNKECTMHTESRCALTKGVVMSTSIYTGLKPFNFIRKHFLQMCLWDVSYERSYCRFKLIKHTSTATSILSTRSTYHSLSAQWPFERMADLYQRNAWFDPRPGHWLSWLRFYLCDFSPGRYWDVTSIMPWRAPYKSHISHGSSYIWHYTLWTNAGTTK